DTIKGYRKVQVSITDDQPMQDAALAQLGVQLYRAGFFTKPVVYERFLGEPDGENMDKARIAEDIRNSPPLQQMVLQELMEEEGLQEQLAEAADGVAQLLEAELGGLPPGAPPGAP